MDDVEDDHVKIETHRPLVKKLNSSAARILIIGQVGFVLVHTTMYMIGLRFWNVVTPYYMLMYVLEEIPNAYNFFTMH